MLIETAQAAGVIDDAPTFADVLSKALYFLLQIAGIIGIIGVVIASLLYFFASGDNKRIALAKKITGASIVGFVLLFGGWIVIKTISGFFLQNR